MSALSIHVTGSVQGVCFRAATLERAEKLGLTGWVRNTKQDGVEIHAEGEASDLQKLEEWCHSGPPSARVESVTVRETEEKGYGEFTIVQ